MSTLVVTSGGRTRPLAAEETSRLGKWRVSTFWVMLLGYVGYYLCRGNLSAAFPQLSEAFGYSNTDLGLIAGWSTLAYAVGKFVNGPLADRFGGRRIFLLGMGGAIVANIVFAMSSSLVSFIVVWCVCRYFLSMGWGGIAKTIGAWYPPHRHGTVMGLVSINFQFGGVAAALFAGFLVAQGIGWQGLFVYPAMVLSVIWIWSYLASREAPRAVVEGAHYEVSESEPHHQIAQFSKDGESPRVTQILKTLFRLSIFRHLLVFSLLTTMLRSVFITWITKFLVDIGMMNVDAQVRTAAIATLGVLGTVLLGWYTDRFARDGDRARAMWIMLSGLGFCLLSVAFLADTGPSAHVPIVVLLALSSFCLLGPYSMSSGCITLDISGSEGAGSCTGMIDGVGYIGASLATLGAGVLSDSMGWSQVFLILSLFAFVATGSAYMMSRDYRRALVHRGAAYP